MPRSSATQSTSEPLERGHWLKPAVDTYAPTRLFTLTIQLMRIEGGDRGEHCGHLWHLCESRRRGEKWSAIAECCGATARSLWEYLRDRGTDQPRLYIIAEDGADALTAMEFWAEVETGRLSLQPHGADPEDEDNAEVNSARPLPLVMGKTCDIVGARWPGGNLRVIAPKNHGLEEWEAIGRSWQRGRHAGFSPTITPRHMDDAAGLRERGRLLMTVYQRYCEWWVRMKCGPWADTSGGMGFAWWRRTLPAKRVLIHDNERAHDAECSAVFGGRQNAYYYGRVIDPTDKRRSAPGEPRPYTRSVLHSRLYHVDFKSMYVSLMKDRSFPTRLIGEFGERDADQIGALARMFDVVARCRVRIVRRSLPCKVDESVLYPAGVWDQWLTTPEILDLHAHGEILRCYGGFKYQSGPVLQDFANEVLALRQAAGDDGDPIGEILAKTVGNAMSGRLARKRTRWVDAPRLLCPEPWGPFQYYPEKGGGFCECRAICGRAQEWKEETRRIAGLTAIYATLTAMGRVEAQRVLAAAGPRGCVSWDTDGGWFTATGLAAISAAGMIESNTPGRLRITAEAGRAQWRTPKHHWIDGSYTLAGVAGGFAVDRKGTITYRVFHNPAREAIDPATLDMSIEECTAEYDHIGPHSPVTVDGWLAPLQIYSGVVSISSGSFSLG